MISAGLLTGLKIALPVGAIATMGGTVYFASGYLPKRSDASDFVYLVVAGKEDNSASSDVLAATTSGKTTKNYVCEATLESNKKLTDKHCSLFNLNSSTSVNTKNIDFNKSMFDDVLLTKAANSVTTSSKHLLKLSKSFYKKFSAITTTTEKQIKLSHTSDATKHFGVVTEEFKFEFSKPIDIAEYSTNLFLARVSTKGTATTPATDPLSCKLSETKSVDCKIYKLTTANKAKTNDLDSTSLTSLTAISLPDTTDTVVGNYVVVELTKERVKPSELQNKLLTINKKPASGATVTTSDKVADVYFDQVLLGKVSTDLTKSTIYPLTPKTATYTVKKSNASSFDAVTSSAKNYKCKFTSNGKDNYDNSCVIKSFPTDPKLHSYESMVTPATGFVGIETGTNSKDHFLLTVDQNKLFNLKPDWTKSTTVNVVAILDDADETKKADFTIQQEIKPKQAEGRTDMALVKYKAKETVSGTASPAVNKCFFEVTDTTGFACTVKKTKTTDASTPPYTNLTFESTDVNSLAQGEHFALITTGTTRPIKDFEAKTIYAHLTESSTTSKYTFEIIAPMGGDIADGKIAYLLEAPRATPSAQ